MPGTIRVSVLEAVDLPEALTDGTIGMGVTVKVTLGPREYKTQPRTAEEGRLDFWNLDFAFPVTNLQDKLVVAICNSDDQYVTQTAIEIPSIIEKGSRDEFVELKGGGRLHLKMSFVLTDEERKKIETMRLAFKRREQERSKRTVVFQAVQPNFDVELQSAPASAVTITEVDASSTIESKDSRETANGLLGFGLTTKPLVPKSMFDYARAVGLQSSQNLKRTGRSLSTDVKANNDINSDVETVRESVKDAYEVGSSEITTLDALVISPRSWKRAASSLTRSTDSASRATVPPSMQGFYTGKWTSGAVKPQVEALESTLPKGRDESTQPANEHHEDKWGIESQRALTILEVEAAAMANSPSEQSSMVEGGMRERNIKRGAMHLARREQIQRWDRQQGTRAGYIREEISKIECQSGHGQRSEARSGAVAGWAQKTGLESRWASPEKAGQIVREWNGQVTDPLKARAKILELMKAAAGSREAYVDGQSFQEQESLADSIGAVLNKVVGGAAMLLAALFRMWPLANGSLLDGSDGSSGDVR